MSLRPLYAQAFDPATSAALFNQISPTGGSAVATAIENAVAADVAAGKPLSANLQALSANVQKGLESSIRSTTASLSAAQTTESYTTSLTSVMGTPGNSSLESDMQALDDPSASSSQAAQELSTVTGDLSTMSSGVQALRLQADGDISNSVAPVNTLLSTIAGINNQIVVDQANGSDTSADTTQLNTAMSSLSQYMNFKAVTQTDGSTTILTSGGTTLVSEGNAETLSFTPATTVTATDTLASGALSGLTTSEGTDISGDLSSGSLSALFTMRDKTLTDAQSQLDGVAQSLANEMNTLGNQAVTEGVNTATGSRTFLYPSTQEISLSGGDSVLSVLSSTGTTEGSTTLSQLMKSTQLANGDTVTNSWSVSDVVSAVNNWLNTTLGTSGDSYASIDANGNLTVQMPSDGSKLSIEDKHTSSFTSSSVVDPTASLNQTGNLSLTDSYGNLYTVAVSPDESLNDIATQLNGVSGISAQVTTQSDGTSVLGITNTAGLDMYIQPDSTNSALLTSLGLTPTGTDSDVTVSLNNDQQGSALTGTSVPDAVDPLGLAGGNLSVTDQNGNQVQYAVTSGDSLTSIAANINASAGSTGISASVVATGNQWALKITGQTGQSLSASGDGATQLGLTPPADQAVSGLANFFGLNDTLSGSNQDVYDSKSLLSRFVTPNASNLTLTSAQTGSTGMTLSFAAGMSLTAIAAQINTSNTGEDGNPVATATVVSTGTGQQLRLTQPDGQPITVTGSLSGMLAISASSVGVSSQLAQNTSQQVTLAGLDQADAVTTKLSTGTHGGLNLNGSLVNAASAVVLSASNSSASTQSNAAYRQVMLDGLNSQLDALTGGAFDTDAQATDLSTYQQAFLQSQTLSSSLASLLSAMA